MQASRPHYVALDGLRGVAALAVMVMHRGRWFYAPGGFIGHAWLAVDFFFLLSGFVIAAAYEERLRSGMSVTAFLRLRLIRLYPLILLGMLLGGVWPLVEVVAGLPGAPAPGDLFFSMIRGLLLLPAVIPDPVGWGIFPLNGPAWSLFFELAVNIGYVLIARRLSTPVLAGIVAVSALAVAVMTFMLTLDQGAEARTFLGGFPRVVFGFSAGLLLYRLRHRLPAFGAPVWVLALVLVAVFVVPHGHHLFELFCIAVVFPVVVILGANAPPGLERVSALSGGLSYPVYALHYPLLVITGGLGGASGLIAAAPAPGFGLIAYPVVIGLCWLAWKLYDEPVRAWLSRLGRPAPARRPELQRDPAAS